MGLADAALVVADAVKQRLDAWQNVVFGIGGTKDPSVYTTYLGRPQLAPEVLEALYIEEHFAAAVIEKLPAEAMRPGWDLVAPGAPTEQTKQRVTYADHEKRLGVLEETFQGACWGRTFGGAITWLGAEDGRKPEEPLDEGAIQTVKFIHTFDKRDVIIASYYADPSHPKFQKPETYRVTPRAIAMANAAGKDVPGNGLAGGVVIHESRCVVWPGQTTTDTRRVQLSGWDDSILERLWEPLKQVGEDFAGKGLLLGRISQSVYKIVDLWKLIAGKQADVLQTRMSMLDAGRSRGRAIILDKEEDLVQVTQPVAGVDQLMGLGVLRLASAADIPISVLMRIPGDNSDRAGDFEMWASQADSWREHVFRPRHWQIARVILLAKDGPTGGKIPEGASIGYRPLRVLSRKEMADVRKTEADTYAIYVDKGLASSEAIAAQKFTASADGGLVLDDAELQAALQRRKELASQPPKDNAELGTVGARASSAMEVITNVATGQIARESGKALLVQLFRFEDTVAEQILGPKDFKPTPPPADPTPGPKPGIPGAGGAGRAPALPGVDDGGDPKKRGTETDPVVE